MQPKNEGCIKNLYSDTPSEPNRKRQSKCLFIAILAKAKPQEYFCKRQEESFKTEVKEEEKLQERSKIGYILVYLHKESNCIKEQCTKQKKFF